MPEVRTTEEFDAWIGSLRDARAKARIAVRIRRMELGLFCGDVKPIGEGLSEVRIDYGPGYRIYFVRRGDVLVVVLAGGDKRSQGKDIRIAKQLASELE
ncbi:type II toxin-antitoxin system RelE/ParE family toxin [Sphingomonas sp.]|uniref:type II toxin-antitoxin system RelE/ParE family toxin n=1 Tax=Sphingomonas sp. TaxID=28214 RepID=UPI002ED99081